MKARDLIRQTALVTTAWANGDRHRQVIGSRSADGLDAFRRPILIGGIIVAITFFGFGLWAAIAPLGSAAIAPGTIAAESGRQTIQHLEGGIVKEILVQEGDHVKAGDVLVKLEGTRARAEAALVQGQLDLGEATRARLLAERDGLSKPEFPPELVARAADPDVAQLIAGQSNLFAARSASLNGQKSILQQRIAQYQDQVQGYSAIKVAKEAQLKIVKTELVDYSSLLADGIVAKPKVDSLQRENAQLEGDRGQVIAEMSRAEQGIGEAKQQILQIEKQHQEDVSKDLHQVEGQLDDTRQRAIAAQDVVKRLEIVAPLEGTVANLNVHTVGGVISPGFALMEVVPANDKLVVDAELSPLEIASVNVGDEVSLRVSTAEARQAPVIYGKLEEISEDRSPAQNGRGAYKVRIVIPPEQVARLGDLKLHIGMPVQANINTGSQTALHYALRPLLNRLSQSFRER